MSVYNLAYYKISVKYFYPNFFILANSFQTCLLIKYKYYTTNKSHKKHRNNKKKLFQLKTFFIKKHHVTRSLFNLQFKVFNQLITFSPNPQKDQKLIKPSSKENSTQTSNTTKQHLQKFWHYQFQIPPNDKRDVP